MTPRPLAVLFAVALVVRLLFFGLIVEQIGPDSLLEFTPDVKQYTTSADAIRGQFDFDTEGVVTFGPGYPAFLALLGFALSPHPYVLILLQIILSALGSVFVAMFAFELAEDTKIALIAGLLNALSITSIVLASVLLSETVFFSLMALGFLFFVKGLKTEKTAYFLLTTFTLSLAALVRSVGQILFLLLLVMAVTYAWPAFREGPKSFVRKLIRPLVTVGLIIAVLAAWAVRNERLYGFNQIALAPYGGMAQLVRLARAEMNGSSYEEASHTLADELEGLQADSMSHYGTFAAHTSNCVRRLVREHPEIVARVFWGNVFDQVHHEWGEHYPLLPRWREQLKSITGWINKKGLNYRVSLLSVIGVIMLLKQKKFRLVIILAVIYSYFALPSGFTHRQSCRIFYPGEVAWTILVAYPLLFLYRRCLKAARLAWLKLSSVRRP